MDYRVAFITGAANGIGRELSLLLAREGIAIAALDLQGEGLAALKSQIESSGGKCATVVGDVTDAAGLRKSVAELESALGPVDLLVANAGIGIETSGLSYSAEDMSRILGVNLLGVSNSIAAVLPGMLQRRRGHLVAMSSVASYRGLPRMLGYCASKSGVNALMEGLRLELMDHGVHVTTICPGWIRTAMTAQIDGQLAGILECDDAARRIWNAIRHKKTFYAFPRAMVWQMRFLNALPNFARDALLRRMLQQLKRKKAV